MFCSVLRPYYAVLLLLCLGRTLLPETWVLAWHPHAHTTYEPAFRERGAATKPRLLLTARHQHCHAEQFYHVPFVPGSAAAVPLPRRRAYYPVLAQRGYFASPRPAARRANPRGPPTIG